MTQRRGKAGLKVRLLALMVFLPVSAVFPAAAPGLAQPAPTETAEQQIVSGRSGYETVPEFGGPSSVGSNFEVLKQMTSTAGEVLALSGPRNPYSAGKLGVIEKGAYADILLVDGNPLKDISVIGGASEWFDADPEWKPIETLNLIMKDGVIYKNSP